jgi:ABC-type hemin transport system ATPase subunit
VLPNYWDDLAHGGRVKTQGNVEDVLTARETSEVFAFHVQVDQNPIDGTKRLTIGNKK